MYHLSVVGSLTVVVAAAVLSVPLSALRIGDGEKAATAEVQPPTYSPLLNLPKALSGYAAPPSVPTAPPADLEPLMTRAMEQAANEKETVGQMLMSNAAPNAVGTKEEVDALIAGAQRKAAAQASGETGLYTQMVNDITARQPGATAPPLYEQMLSSAQKAASAAGAASPMGMGLAGLDPNVVGGPYAATAALLRPAATSQATPRNEQGEAGAADSEDSSDALLEDDYVDEAKYTMEAAKLHAYAQASESRTQSMDAYEDADMEARLDDIIHSPADLP